MLLNEMDISRLTIYAQQIEKSKLRDWRRPRVEEPSKPKPKKRFYQQNTFLGNNDRSPKENSQGGGHAFERSICVTGGKKHLGKYLVAKAGCFGCDSKFYKIRYCTNLNANGMEVD